MENRRNIPALVLGISSLVTFLVVTLVVPFPSRIYYYNNSSMIYRILNDLKLGAMLGWLVLVIYILSLLSSIAVLVAGIFVYLGKTKLKILGLVSSIFETLTLGFLLYWNSVGSLMTGILFLLIVIGLTVAYCIFIFKKQSVPEVDALQAQPSYNEPVAAPIENGNHVNEIPQTKQAEAKPQQQKHSNNNGAVFYHLKGVQRLLDVYEDRVVLTQLKNMRAFLTHDLLKGTKEIPFYSMSSIQYKPGSGLLLGYIQFEVPGVASRDNYGSENSWTFEKEYNATAEKVVEYCRKRLAESKKPHVAVLQQGPSQVSAADELKKFKELLDAGVITQEEFDEQKRKILNH